jgi:hypothetical protein
MSTRSSRSMRQTTSTSTSDPSCRFQRDGLREAPEAVAFAASNLRSQAATRRSLSTPAGLRTSDGRERGRDKDSTAVSLASPGNRKNRAVSSSPPCPVDTRHLSQNARPATPVPQANVRYLLGYFCSSSARNFSALLGSTLRMISLSISSVRSSLSLLCGEPT